MIIEEANFLQMDFINQMLVDYPITFGCSVQMTSMLQRCNYCINYRMVLESFYCVYILHDVISFLDWYEHLLLTFNGMGFSILRHANESSEKYTCEKDTQLA